MITLQYYKLGLVYNAKKRYLLTLHTQNSPLDFDDVTSPLVC